MTFTTSTTRNKKTGKIKTTVYVTIPVGKNLKLEFKFKIQWGGDVMVALPGLEPGAFVRVGSSPILPTIKNMSE